MWRSIARVLKFHAREYPRRATEGEKVRIIRGKYSKVKIRSWKARNILGRIKALDISRQDHPACFISSAKGRCTGLVLKTRTKQRNVTFDVSPETAEMAAHCLDYKLIWRSILRRATSCARPCTRWLAESKSTTTAAATGSRLLWVRDVRRGRCVFDRCESRWGNAFEGDALTSSDLRIGRDFFRIKL